MFVSLLLLLFVVGNDKLIRRMKIHAHETASNRILYDYLLIQSVMTFFSSSFVSFLSSCEISLLLHLVVVIGNLLEG
jgi:hypothetical protein